MKYLLLIYGEETNEQVPEEVMAGVMDAYAAFSREIVERALYKGGEALEPTSTATTVRVRDGRTLTTDGPFAETKEALGGYYLIDAKDLDEAIEVAAKIPGATTGSVEVRPVWEIPAEYAAPEASGARAS